MKLKKLTAVNTINPHCVRVPVSLAKSLNGFFKKYPYLLEGCTIRDNWDYGAKFALIIEESPLYDFLNYGCELGWDVHTAWHESFKGCNWHPEMINSCVVGFYE
jgi:hypothetical protein